MIEIRNFEDYGFVSLVIMKILKNINYVTRVTLAINLREAKEKSPKYYHNIRKNSNFIVQKSYFPIQ